MPHRSPNRPKHDISQSYNSGIVTLCTVSDTAEPGLQPQPTPVSVLEQPYEEQKLGIQRYYASLQAQARVERVIRVQRTHVPVTSQMLAQTEDGTTYRIDLVQTVDCYPPSLDLSLVRYVQGAPAADAEGTEVSADE